MNIKLKKKEMLIKKCSVEKCCIITPHMVKYYKKQYKILLRLYKDKEKVLNILYKKIYEKYAYEKDYNYSLERIYIKTKLGSYLSGGCGIGPSLLTSLVGSGIFTYMNSLLKKLNGTLTLIYFSIVTGLAIYLLTMVDNEVEMYNLMLEIIENIEKEYMHR